MSNTDLIRHLRAERAKHFDALGDLLFDAARALEAAETDRRVLETGRTVSMSEDELFLQRRTIHYVEFGGIGGDIAAITITTEAWRDLGSPETVKVIVAPGSADLEPVKFDPPLTEAEADAYWDAISDEPESADPVASTPPCECSCHTMPGVMHVAACCQAGLTAQPNRTQEEA